MDTPEEESDEADYLQNITIPLALISKIFGDNLKKALEDGDMVNINLDWRESLPHPDEHVEYEFWTTSNDECGPKCDSQIEFVKSFKGAAQVLKKKTIPSSLHTTLLGTVLELLSRANSANRSASTMEDIVPPIQSRTSAEVMMGEIL